MPIIFYISYIAQWILLVILSALVLLLYRHFGLMALGTVEGIQRDGLSVGETAPLFSGIIASGEAIAWEPIDNHTYFLAFVSPTCAPCARVIPFINQVAATMKNVQVVLVVAGLRDNAALLIDTFHLEPSILCIAEEGSGASERYRVRVTPFAFLVGANKRILAKGLCDKPERLQEMLSASGQEIPYFTEVNFIK